MTVEEIFIKVSSHMLKGLLFHNQLSHLYGFLNLKGYQQQQQHQYFEQSKAYFNLKNFYLCHYDKMINETPIDRLNVIPVNWYKYTRMEVDINTKRAAIQDAYKQWLAWEQETKQLLNECYQQLYNLKQIYASEKIINLIQDVNEEIHGIKEAQINLESTNYDMVFILDAQDNLYKQYGGDD